MVVRLNLPSRNVLGLVSHQDQRMIKWFEDTSVALNGFGGGLSDGDKGDITVSDAGGAWIINGGAVTLAKMANLTAETILGNNTGGNTTPIALTPAQVKALLAITAADVSGLVVTATGDAVLTLATNRFEHEETVAAVGVTGTSRVNVWLAPASDADENVPEMIDLITMSAAPGIGQITVTAAFDIPTAGPLKIQWSAA